MGRQIAVAMDLNDERAFLAFLRSTANVLIYRSWSPTPTSADEFTAEAAASPFYIHNTSFPWSAEFELVNVQVQGQAVSYYRLLDTGAPLLQYSRHPLKATFPQVSGRVYWAKDFSGPVKYDVAEFDKWFSKVANWVQHQGVKLRHGSTEAWCMSGAREVVQR
jgi:hypothetical protein